MKHWRGIFLLAFIASIIIFSSVHQHIGWSRVAYWLEGSSQAQKDSVGAGIVRHILTEEAVGDYLSNRESASEQAFTTASLILSAVSLFLVVVALLLFREYDNLKEYKERLETMMQENKKAFLHDMTEFNAKSDKSIEKNTMIISDHISDVQGQLKELSDQTRKHKELIDAVPIMEDEEFEAIFEISAALFASGILDPSTNLNLKLIYYMKLLNPLSESHHRVALHKIIDILPELPKSPVLGTRLDRRLQKLIIATKDESIRQLAFEAQRALHWNHPSY